jgi:hypothetical protein
MVVAHYFNSMDQPPSAPTRQHLVAVLERLFEDGRGAIMDPLLLHVVVLFMGSYLKLRTTWDGVVSDSGSTAGRKSFEDKVQLELQLLVKLQLLVMEDGLPIEVKPNALEGVFSGASSQYTVAEFMTDYEVGLWEQLIVPLTDDEVGKVFQSTRYSL